MGVFRWILVGPGLGLLLAACSATPVPVPTVTPVPVPTFRCTPEVGGAEFGCSRAEYEELQAKEALWQEAEAVYRKFLAEDARIMRAGGVAEPTKVLLETTSGAYLEDVMSVYKEMHSKGITAEGADSVLVSSERIPGRTKSGANLSITTCVDGTTFEFFADGKSLGMGSKALDENYLGMVDGVLKLVGADGEVVDSC